MAEQMDDELKKKKKKKKAKKADKAGKAQKASKTVHDGMDKLGAVLDHPLVAELIAVGATAAVAAIAESGLSSKTAAGQASGKGKTAVKAAGKAAAAAIGRRLMGEFNAAKAKKAD